MCGRFSLTGDEQGFSDRFNFRGEGVGHAPREQIYPTNRILTVLQAGPNRLGVMMYWGFLPVWANGKPLINAQSEKVATSATWRKAYRERRCLVPADGFFEWRKNADGTKTMMRIALRSGQVFAMAGLWGEFQDRKGDMAPCATIVTTVPNALMQSIHNRMPVILAPEAEALWLDPMSADPAVLGKVLAPYPEEGMHAEPYESRRASSPEFPGFRLSPESSMVS